MSHALTCLLAARAALDAQIDALARHCDWPLVLKQLRAARDLLGDPPDQDLHAAPAASLDEFIVTPTEFAYLCRNGYVTVALGPRFVTGTRCRVRSTVDPPSTASAVGTVIASVTALSDGRVTLHREATDPEPAVPAVPGDKNQDTLVVTPEQYQTLATLGRVTGLSIAARTGTLLYVLSGPSDKGLLASVVAYASGEVELRRVGGPYPQPPPRTPATEASPGEATPPPNERCVFGEDPPDEPEGPTPRAATFDLTGTATGRIAAGAVTNTPPEAAGDVPPFGALQDLFDLLPPSLVRQLGLALRMHRVLSQVPLEAITFTLAVDTGRTTAIYDLSIQGHYTSHGAGATVAEATRNLIEELRAWRARALATEREVVATHDAQTLDARARIHRLTDEWPV